MKFKSWKIKKKKGVLCSNKDRDILGRDRRAYVSYVLQNDTQLYEALESADMHMHICGLSWGAT